MSSILKVSEIQDPTNGNTALEIDSGGRLTMPTQPRFLCQLTSNTAIASGNDSSWSVDDATWTEKFDVGGCFSGGVFTSPVAGTYQLHFQTYVNPSSGTYIGAAFHGSGIEESFGTSGNIWSFRANANDAGLQHSILIDISAGKEVKLGTYGSTSHTARADGTFWWGVKVA